MAIDQQARMACCPGCNGPVMQDGQPMAGCCNVLMAVSDEDQKELQMSVEGRLLCPDCMANAFPVGATLLKRF